MSFFDKAAMHQKCDRPQISCNVTLWRFASQAGCPRNGRLYDKVQRMPENESITQRSIRRRMLAGAAGAIILNAQPGVAQGAAPQFAIQTDYSAALDRDDVYSFLDGSQPTWDEPLFTGGDYVESRTSRKELGAIPKPIKMYWAVRRFFALVIGPGRGQLIGHFDCMVTIEQQVNVVLKAALLLKKNLPQAVQTKIEGWFSQYDPDVHGDPFVYARDRIASDASVNVDMFSVVNALSINKIPSTRREHDQQLKALLGLYNGSTAGKIWLDTNGQESVSAGAHFKKSQVRSVLLRSTLVGRLDNPDKPRDSSSEVTAGPGDNPKNIMKDLGDKEAQRLDCGDPATSHEWPVIVLDGWPEFMVELRDFEYKIKCVRVVLRLPVLLTRTAMLQLWASMRIPGKTIVAEVLTCHFRSALSPSVIGIALANPPAAVVAYLALIEQCIDAKLGKAIPCLIPGLTLIKTVKPPGWQPL